MSDQHTPGRLHVTDFPGDADVPNGCYIGIDDDFGSEGGRDYYLFTAVHGDPDELAANARRLVACWNACEGVPTKWLEAYPAPFTELRTQRDELLAALQGVAAIAHSGGLVEMSESDALIAIRRATLTYWDSSASDDQTRAAIAKVKGGAA